MPDEAPNYTNPNLNRLIPDPDVPDIKCSVFISGVNSFKMVETTSDHDEDSDDDEIP